MADVRSSCRAADDVRLARHLRRGRTDETGGIRALGLGAGKSAREIRDLYMHRGPEIFPPVWDNILGRWWKAFRNNILNVTFNRYSR